MKIGVFTVCTPDFEVNEAAAEIAAAGYDGVEWRVTKDEGDRSKPTFWNGNRTSMTAAEVISRADELKKLVAEFSLEMPSIASYVDVSDLALVEACLQAAAAIGAKSIRVGPGHYPQEGKSYADIMQGGRELYSRVAEMARNHGVKALIETHPGHIAPSVSKAMQVLEGLDPQDVGIMWDPCNQIIEGIETYRMAIDIAGPYLAEVHVKNSAYIKRQEGGETKWSVVACPLDQGVVQWSEVVAELKRVDYDGWLILEDFSEELPLRDRLAFNSSYLRSILAG